MFGHSAGFHREIGVCGQAQKLHEKLAALTAA
jgi:hypothetical protein